PNKPEGFAFPGRAFHSRWWRSSCPLPGMGSWTPQACLGTLARARARRPRDSREPEVLQVTTERCGEPLAEVGLTCRQGETRQDGLPSQALIIIVRCCRDQCATPALLRPI